MGPAVFVIAIMGCGEGEAPCQQLRLADSRYESAAACTAATTDVVMRHIDVDYPVVVAQCRPVSGDAQPLRPREVRLPEPEETALFPRG